MRWLAAMFVLAFPAASFAATLQSPADAIALAWQDASRIPAEQCQHLRWLWRQNLPDEDWQLLLVVMAGHVNALSTQPDVVRPVLVGASLLRVDLDDYGWDYKVWESLADQEPYFHSQVEKVTRTSERAYWPGGVNPSDGKNYPAGWYNQTDTKRAKTTALAPWLSDTRESQLALGQLVSRTQSQVPVVSADWFFFQTAIQADRKPGYYDFLGIKDEKTFQKLVGFVNKEQVNPNFLRELREAVASSTVTLQPRRVERIEKVGGGLWRTRDVRQAVDKKNPLRVLDDVLDFDATEQFASLPNGFWATGLFNNKGVRVDSAPDFIASDATTTSNDRRVHINLSCLRCHVEGGLQGIDGWVRNVLNDPPLYLQSADKETARILRANYVRRLEPYLEADRNRYRVALFEATGLKAEAYAASLSRVWQRYSDTPVTLDVLGQEMGMPGEEARKRLRGYTSKTGQIDPVVASYLRDQPRPVPRVPFLEAYPLIQNAVRGYQQP